MQEYMKDRGFNPSRYRRQAWAREVLKTKTATRVDGAVHRLTPRQEEIVRLSTGAGTADQIGQHLGIKGSTVKAVVCQLRKKGHGDAG